MISLDSMFSGALIEKFQLAMSQVARNIMDLNTDPEKKRVITIKITLAATETRRHVTSNMDISVKLVPPNGDKGVFFIGQDVRTGQIQMQEDGSAGKISVQGVKDGELKAEIV